MIGEFFRFVGWSVMGMVFVLLVMGLSVFFLIYYWGLCEVGIFGVVMSFVVILEYVVGVIISV